MAARCTARRHDGAEHHRAEPHQRSDGWSSERSGPQQEGGQSLAGERRRQTRRPRLAAEQRRGRPGEATKIKSPWVAGGEERRASFGAGGSGRERPGKSAGVAATWSSLEYCEQASKTESCTCVYWTPVYVRVCIWAEPKPLG